MSLNPSIILQWRELKSLDRTLLILSIICGVSYLLAPFLFAEQIRTYWPLNAIVKGLAVSSLAIIAFRLLQGRDRLLLCTALVFSSLGDVFLALRNGNYFVFGLLSFLIAHLFFITLWLRHWNQPLRANGTQKLIVASLLLFLGAMLWWMLPIPGLSLPVAIYMCVLTTMVITSALAEFKRNWVVIGAILFLISDTLIALSTFKHVIEGRLAGFLIWSTYYVAQYLITFGFLIEIEKKNFTTKITKDTKRKSRCWVSGVRCEGKTDHRPPTTSHQPQLFLRVLGVLRGSIFLNSIPHSP